MIVTVGYATLTTNLTINGTSKINNSTWDVHFEGISVLPGSVAINTSDYAQAQAATIDSQDTTKISYNVLLSEPGDFYDFTVKAVNGGSIDAMISQITPLIKVNNVDKTNDIPAWLDYSVTYNDLTQLQVNDELPANSYDVYRVRVAFKKDITNAQFSDAIGKTVSLDLEVKYEQKGTSAQTHTYSGTRYTMNEYTDDGATFYNRIQVGGTIAKTMLQFSTKEAVKEAIKNKSGLDINFFLKHTVTDGTVTASYIEFTVTDAMKAIKPSVVPGTYTIKGYDGTSYYSANETTLLTAFGNDMTICSITDHDIYCGIDNLHVSADSDGHVGANNGNGSYCNVGNDKWSACHYETN